MVKHLTIQTLNLINSEQMICFWVLFSFLNWQVLGHLIGFPALQSNCSFKQTLSSVV